MVEQPFPMSAVISGVEVVTIPVTHYAELLAVQSRYAHQLLNHRQLSTPRRGVIDRNPEVAIFLAQSFGLKSVKTILRECKRQFGRDRTPSQTAAYKYWLKLRTDSRTRGAKV